MTKQLNITEQEELFSTECKLINLKYEYQGYTGTVKWAVVSELSEKELFEKYPDVISRYTPFVLLSVEQGEVIAEAKRNDDKFAKRAKRSGHIFDVDTDDFAKYDPSAENQIEIDGETKGITTLPRLVLGYYLILATGVLGIMVIVWLLTRKKQTVRLWVERIGLYPVAYIVSHCIVSGINWTTYSISRDFSLIIFLSILLYSGLLLAHNIWYLKKEIKTVNRL